MTLNLTSTNWRNELHALAISGRLSEFAYQKIVQLMSLANKSGMDMDEKDSQKLLDELFVVRLSDIKKKYYITVRKNGVVMLAEIEW